jgi:hypothetical protein
VLHLAHELPLFVEELSKSEIAVKRVHVNELLLQTLEHERGGVQVYETAPRCVQNEELQKGWCRELWIRWLGMKAALPPPEEQKQSARHFERELQG